MMTCAIPTGRLGKQTLELLYQKRVTQTLIEPGRQLQITDPSFQLTFLFVKPSDVITYVTSGLADIGIVGSDLIEETKADIYELLDLNIGKCQMIVAGLNEKAYVENDHLVVSTKFKNTAKSFFKTRHQTVDIKPLNGSVELAPLIALSDVIVDITETGTTLKENGLLILDVISSVTARLICNQASFYLNKKEVETLKERLNV
jgi:ATP phosphoribosyltransferase